MSDTYTKVICRIPLVGCLQKAEEFQGLPNTWEPINQQQIDFMRHLATSDELNKLSKEEFDAIANTDADVINSWLEEHGFSLKCPQIPSGGFGTASVAKFFVLWKDEGIEQEIDTPAGKKPFVFFNSTSVMGKQVTHGGTTWHMSRLETKDTDTNVYVAMPDDITPMDEETMISLANSLTTEYIGATFCYEKMRMPMINLDITIQQDWIKGLRNEGWFVQDCIQQFILKLNEKGATAKSAAAMTFARSMVTTTKPVLTINKPFLLWFERKGITYPVFLAFCDYDVWEKPENLD